MDEGTRRLGLQVALFVGAPDVALWLGTFVLGRVLDCGAPGRHLEVQHDPSLVVSFNRRTRRAGLGVNDIVSDDLEKLVNRVELCRSAERVVGHEVKRASSESKDLTRACQKALFRPRIFSCNVSDFREI